MLAAHPVVRSVEEPRDFQEPSERARCTWVAHGVLHSFTPMFLPRGASLALLDAGDMTRHMWSLMMLLARPMFSLLHFAWMLGL